jgi:hypothetical protein
VHKNTDFDGWNEETVRDFVKPVLRLVMIKLWPEYDTAVRNEEFVADQKLHGRVDMEIKSKKAILLAIETKCERIKVGVAQNLLQLDTTRKKNMRNGIDLGDTMYGIVTTGCKWVLTKAVFNADGKPTVSITKPMYLSIKDKVLSKDEISKQLGLLHGCIEQDIVEQAKKLYRSD